jgi:hypothetical protein
LPRRTNSDIIRELENKVTLLNYQVETLIRESASLTSLESKIADKLHELQLSQMEKLQQLQREVAVLNDFKTRREETDRRQWLIWVAAVGSLLTLAGNLILFFLKG